VDSAMLVNVYEERSSVLVRRSLHIGGSEAAYFEISGDALPPPLELHDFAAIATIFLAMREGRPLHIDGPVSSALLRNLEEFQEAWALWLPNDYRQVAISAKEEVDAAPSGPRDSGVFAFSGGVDSVSSLIRHHDGDLGRRAVRAATAVLIHGFDIPLSETVAFDAARRGAEAILSELNIPLSIVRTNWRETLRRRWEMEFGAGVAACMHQFAGTGSTGIVGSSEDYAHIVWPWGSNPITDHMLSSSAFSLRLECRGLTRTERVAVICRYPRIARHLRVCWEGPITGENCGQCEKCIRTKLNFLAAGFEPLCFDGPPTWDEILRVRAKNVPQIALLEEIHMSAQQRGIKEPWVMALGASIQKNKTLRPIRPLWSRGQNKIKRTILGALPGRH
jgi:hypothetical protein